MVAPTPTAAPLTAATIGFWQRASACRKRMIGAPSPPLRAIVTKSLRSLPAQKTSGAPAIRTQRTPSAEPASSIAAAMASYIASVSAFFLSGRFIRILRTGPSLLITTSGIRVPSQESGLFRHARLYAGHPRLDDLTSKQDVDGRNKSGHDGS